MHFRDENILNFCYIHDNSERHPTKAEQLGQANVYRRVMQHLFLHKIQATLKNTYLEGYCADHNEQIEIANW